MTSIASGAFVSCHGLVSISVESDNPKYDSRNNCNAIIETSSNRLIVGCKNTIIPNTVTIIYANAFDGCLSLTALDIPNSVTGIGKEAFHNCSSLASLTIPGSVKWIESSAFWGCGLTSITIENGVKSIGQYAFGASGLTSVDIPSSVAQIGRGAFQHCRKLTSVNIPKDVTSLDRTFEGCTNLTSVKVEQRDPLVVSDNYVFPNRANAFLYVPRGCKTKYEAANYWNEFKEIIEMDDDYAEDITFADSNVKAICVEYWDTNHDGELSDVEAEAVSNLNTIFRGKPITNFNELKYFTNVTNITSANFDGCDQLTELTLPWSITSVEPGSFSSCTSLVSIQVDNKNNSYYSSDGVLCSGREFSTSSSIVAYPNGKGISYESYNNIGDKAFYGTQISEITLHNNPQIASTAFENCPNLRTVILSKYTTQAVIDDAFPAEVYSSATLYVPFGKLDYYVNLDGWKNFRNIQESEIQEGNVLTLTVDDKDTEDGARVAMSFKVEKDLYNELELILSKIDNCSSVRGTNYPYTVYIPAEVRGIPVRTIYGPLRQEQGYSTKFNPRKVCLPPTLYDIRMGAFEGCTNLDTLVFTGPIVPSLSHSTGIEDIFDASHFNHVVLVVPAGKKNDFLATDWNRFANIVEEENGERLQFMAQTKDGIMLTYQNQKNINFMTCYVGRMDRNERGYHAPAIVASKTVGDEDDQWPSRNAQWPDVTAYSPYEGSIVLPDIIGKTGSSNSKHRVSGFDISLFFSIITSLTIPQYCWFQSNDVFAYDTKYLKEILVSENNEWYTSVNGVLYSKNKTELIKYPSAADANKYIVPAGTKSLSRSAISYCDNLTEIVLQEGVESINYRTFAGCNNLKKISIPVSLSSFPVSRYDCAIEECDSLTSITVASNNEKYDSRDNCNAIIETATNTLIFGCKSTTIPASVTSIGVGAFQYCRGLTSLTIPSSVTSIGDYAFSGCSGLTSVTVGWDTPLSINANVFKNVNYNNVTLYVPKGTKAAYEAADGWKDFGTIEEIGGATTDNIIEFADAAVKAICVSNWDTDHDGELSKQEAAAVKDLSGNFNENSEITSFDELQYFTGLTQIHGWAFQSCTKLTSVIIPDGVTTIGPSAFEACPTLTSLTMPHSLTTIGDFAFNGCI